MEGNEIYAYETVDGEEEIKFHIPAPFMYDADDNYNEDVSYELFDFGVEIQGNNMYYLTIVANEDWINEEGRAFPVVIDPQVKSISVTKEYSFVDNGSGKVTSDDGFRVGKAFLTTRHDLWLKFVISDSQNYTVLSATLEYAITPKGSGTSFKMDWVEKYSDFKNPVTYKNLDIFSGTVDKINTRKISLAPYMVYNNLCLKFYETHTGSSNYYGTMDINSIKFTYYLTDIYSSASYESFSGDGYKTNVNMFTTEATTYLDLISLETESDPISITAIHSPGLSDLFSNYALTGLSEAYKTFYGKDTKLNIEQYCVPQYFTETQ